MGHEQGGPVGPELPAETPRQPSREAVWTLQIFRGALGLWLLVSPLILDERFNALGVSDVVCGLTVLATVAFAFRFPRLRLVLFPLAVWLGFSPFVFEVQNEFGIYSEIVVAKVLLVSAFVSPEMFD
jgi:hypothetical protein